MGLVLIACCCTGSTLDAGEFFRIHLRSGTVSAGEVVKIRDIATVTGTNAQTVARLEELDVAALTTKRPQDRIKRDRLTIRLLLAGYDGQRIAITGADAVDVRYQPNRRVVRRFDVASVESAARVALASVFDVTPDDVDARLASPIEVALEESGRPLTVDVLAPENPRPGRMRLSIRVFSGNDLTKVTSGLFDVRLRQRVVLASSSLPVGAAISASNITYQDRWVTKRVTFPQLGTSPQWKVRRTIQAGETITTNDLLPIAPEDENPVVIHTRDVVQLVARGKGITATVPAAEALEDGRVGETIRFRNMQSRRVIVGKVISADEVEVRF